MKIMITSRGETLNSPVDERFGRAEVFIIYDSEIGEYEAVKNPFLNSQGGVGISAAKFAVEKGVDALVSGSFGPNALEVLKASSIKLYKAEEGTVKENIDKLLQGKLKEF